MALLGFGVYRGLIQLQWVLGSEQTPRLWLDYYSQIVNSLLWLPLVPLLMYLGKRFPLDEPRWPRHLLIHIPLATGIGWLQVFVWKTIEFSVARDENLFSFAWGFAQDFNSRLMMVGAVNNYYKYGVILGIFYFIRYQTRLRQREAEAHRLLLRTETLENRLSRARLDALRMQLNPHFLFNTLNTISVYVDEDPEKANSMLVGLSSLLRSALRENGKPVIALAEELSFVRRYLEIEAVRFEDRLHITIDVPDSLLSWEVPAFILQPLVENAVKHGFSSRVEGGCIEIKAREERGRLLLQVDDDGRGFHENQGEDTGIGLKNTRDRLAALYDDEAGLEIAASSMGGASLRLFLPEQPRVEVEP